MNNKPITKGRVIQTHSQNKEENYSAQLKNAKYAKK